MKKYIVGLANLYDGSNKLHIVEANSPIEAMKIVLGLQHEEFSNVEKIQAYAHDGELLISEPMEL